jgi:YHS domain-containing protein
MRVLFVLFIINTILINAQQIDYNTKKGFVANGYDVVSYFEGNAVEGNKKFTTKFDGTFYKFSTLENLYSFKENPNKYIPQYGGYCAYAIGAKAEKVKINPETYQILDGKLYLFYNAWGTNTLELWKKDLKGLKQKADKNWERIKMKN